MVRRASDVSRRVCFGKTVPARSDILHRLARLLSEDAPEEAASYRTCLIEAQKRAQISDRVYALNNSVIAASEAADWPQAIMQMSEALVV